MSAIRIGEHLVGAGHPCFVVAEIGINHNGSLETALRLIDVAIDAGCNAVKFQKRTVNVVYSPQELARPRAVDSSIIDNALSRCVIEGVQYDVLPSESVERLKLDPHNTTNGDLKYALEFGMKEFDIIDIYCRKRGIYWLASAWDGQSAHFLNGFDVACHKVASACLTHADLLRRVRSNGKPVILSTGGSTLEQVKSAVSILGRDGLIILHCVANYPCEDFEINLGVMDSLRIAFPGVPIGYSGHERGIIPSVAAAAMGASVIERHITLDKNMPGSDHLASLEPNELKQMVEEIRRIEVARGDGIKRILSSEMSVMAKLRRKEDF